MKKRKEDNTFDPNEVSGETQIGKCTSASRLHIDIDSLIKREDADVVSRVQN